MIDIISAEHLSDDKCNNKNTAITRTLAGFPAGLAVAAPTTDNSDCVGPLKTTLREKSDIMAFADCFGRCVDTFTVVCCRIHGRRRWQRPRQSVYLPLWRLSRPSWERANKPASHSPADPAPFRRTGGAPNQCPESSHGRGAASFLSS